MDKTPAEDVDGGTRPKCETSLSLKALEKFRHGTNEFEDKLGRAWRETECCLSNVANITDPTALQQTLDELQTGFERYQILLGRYCTFLVWIDKDLSLKDQEVHMTINHNWDSSFQNAIEEAT